MAVDADRDVTFGTEDGLVNLYTAGVLCKKNAKFPRLQASIKIYI